MEGIELEEGPPLDGVGVEEEAKGLGCVQKE